MNKDKSRISVEQFESVIEVLKLSMDDYLYIYDIKYDYYSISPNAMERFQMEEYQFHDVFVKLMELVYPADREALGEELGQLISGEKTFHNLQYRWLGKDGKSVWINCRGQVFPGEDGQPRYLIGCINEIGKQQKADNISGLLREVGLRQELAKHRDDRMSGFLMRLGIDNFREINENRGMDYGDMILRKTAECVETVLAPEQKLYRIVADEFMVVDLTGTAVEEAEQLYHQIRQEIDKFIEDNGYEVFYTISVGILDLDDIQNQEYENISKLSEFALTEAKNRGKNQSYVYNRVDYDRFKHKRKLIRTMRKSVNAEFEGFETYFQPIMDINSGRLTTAETLLRFHSEEVGFVSPVEFIPLLEESGLIIPVGRWVLHKAMEACSFIQEKIPEFRVSVNLSYIQVLKSDVLEDILEGIKRYDLKPGSIIIELTESGFLESDESFIRFCNGLRENGILLALDDFGTGYSNFHYLYNLSPDTIKIDRSFTLKALGNSYEYNLLRYMVDMAHSINLKMCIEGIETKEELMKICEMGPDYIQGYYFGRPCAFDIFLHDHVHTQLEEKA